MISGDWFEIRSVSTQLQLNSLTRRLFSPLHLTQTELDLAQHFHHKRCSSHLGLDKSTHLRRHAELARIRSASSDMYLRWGTYTYRSITPAAERFNTHVTSAWVQRCLARSRFARINSRPIVSGRSRCSPGQIGRESTWRFLHGDDFSDTRDQSCEEFRHAWCLSLVNSFQLPGTFTLWSSFPQRTLLPSAGRWVTSRTAARPRCGP